MPRRLRTPTILQMEATECGAAALGIVLAHHGLWLPLEDLRIRCGVSRDGSRASHITRAARQLGMEVQAFRAEPEALGGMALPAILHWGMDHFVVLEGGGGDQWFINDPARGPRRVDGAEFARQFTGIVLSLKPGPDFRPAGSAPSLRRALAARLDGAWPGFWFLLGVSLLLLVPGLLLPAASQVFIDQVLVAQLQSWLPGLLMAMAGLAALMAGLTWLQLRVLLRLETYLAVGGANRFLRHVLRLPVTFFAQRHSGDIASRVLLNDRLAALLAGDIGRVLLAMIGAAVYLAAMAAYDGLLALVVLGLSAINLLALRVLSRRLADDNHRLLVETGLSNGEARQGLQMLDAYKASGSEVLLLRRMMGRQARILNLRQGLAMRRALTDSLPAAIGVLSAAAVLVLGGLRVTAGEMTVGALVAFQGLMLGFAVPVQQLTALGAQIQDARAYLGLLDDTLRHPQAPEFAAAGGSGPIRRLEGRIGLEDIRFGHSPLAPPLLDGISLTVPVGGRLGIVGASGCGKSTLAGLIAGLHRPWSGTVRIDGRPLDEIPRAALRGSVAVVDQNLVLFDGTMRDNLGLWDATLPDERLQAAARDAAIHSDIMARGGYGARVAEEGRNLSGGQRARLEMARALAQDPRILLLDEATAALDPVTEAEVLANLRRRGCTMVVVAHRPSAVRDCDEIIVLEGGRIVQQGAPAALAAQPGPYRRLLQAAA
ncbi:NHLP family bacteriocin export ABC transporter peptidase/permease/ATPase subunit [Roseomonas marmotae]|uniref:NHLP family bacteriocin export ABC transporter peptidase/permease/ATPase subunit n=1 Tax=Roseomonas marmotae TaxID=2768161 RepID=A0ABS3K750_9PROT|nr:NHLP family bacteriocin export ABC transporter peptidase/permease/ATPase subunit [Roseomonas marmotae]MBO1073304.1 NHLP family bacteriocin export ABC transporter peptidase/permease/ATPase subunit [Roseomonas marmotae]QTI79078.1 NHLP family bacteriocin export ABC transporter peptidase/permease/ATPase subunit [Roseomonas marmotae]